MSDQRKGGIAWCDETWNPVSGCTKVSAGCKFCWAESQSKRFWHRQYPMIETKEGSFIDGLQSREFLDVQCHPERLDIPLRWKRPRKIAVALMGDLFHEKIPDEFIDRVFAVIALCPQHVFQVLTKRAERMREYLSMPASGHLALDSRADEVGHAAMKVQDCRRGDPTLHIPLSWPLPNAWLGVSVENQETADERIPLLLKTPAAVRWISAEPLLGPIRLDVQHGQGIGDLLLDGINWVVIGGESGPNARPCALAWIRSIVEQCKEAGVPAFVKQLGAQPRDDRCPCLDSACEMNQLRLRDRKGADMDEWPEDLRVREFPAMAKQP